jgi:hypothetical protein
MRRYLVQLPVCVTSKDLRAGSDALDLSDKQAVAVRHLAIALEGFVLLVLSEELLQILLVRHAGRLVLRHILDPVCPRPLVSHPWQTGSRSATRAQRYPRPHCRAVRPRTLRRHRTPRSGLGVRRNLPQDAHSRARARLALLLAPRSESRPHTGSGSAGGLRGLASRMVTGAGSGLVPSAPGAAAGPIAADMLRPTDTVGIAP